MNDAQWREYISELPDTAPGGLSVDVRVPHRGMPSHIETELLERGYQPVDLRFLPASEELYELTVKAAREGIIRLDKNDIDLLRLEADRLGLRDKNRDRNREEKATYGTLDALLDATAEVKLTPATQLRARDRTAEAKSARARSEAPLVKEPRTKIKDLKSRVRELDPNTGLDYIQRQLDALEDNDNE